MSFVSFKSGSGNIQVEVEGLGYTGFEKASNTEKLLPEVTKTFESLLETIIIEPAKAFANSLEKLTNQQRPSEAEVSFSAKIVGETGGFIAIIGKAGAEANFMVRLLWKDTNHCNGNRDDDK
jgi:hypothetical protein